MNEAAIREAVMYLHAIPAEDVIIQWHDAKPGEDQTLFLRRVSADEGKTSLIHRVTAPTRQAVLLEMRFRLIADFETMQMRTAAELKRFRTAKGEKEPA